MRPHVKIRKDYVKLVRQGDRVGARKILQKIWGREIVDSPVEEIPEIVKTTVKTKDTINSLSKINGIGGKTLKDIKRMYKSLDELKVALQNDSVGLRDDIVSKLKENLL